MMGWTINVVIQLMCELIIAWKAQYTQKDDTCRIHADYEKEKYVEYQIVIDNLSRCHINYIK